MLVGYKLHTWDIGQCLPVLMVALSSDTVKKCIKALQSHEPKCQHEDSQTQSKHVMNRSCNVRQIVQKMNIVK